jgi:hypothetical protein
MLTEFHKLKFSSIKCDLIMYVSKRWTFEKQVDLRTSCFFFETYDILEFVLGTNYSFWKKFNQINILGNAIVFPFLSSPFLRSELVDIEINTLCYRYVNFSSILTL